MAKKALIAGAGLGGLATALRLVSRGYHVEIVEKYHQSGGRLNQLVKDGFTFDIGPSFFSMSYEFHELFADCGIENPLALRELDPVYSVWFKHREKPYQIHKDLEKLSREFAAVEPRFQPQAEKYLAQAADIFHDTENVIIRQNFDSKLQYLKSMTGIPVKHTPKLIRNMWSHLGRYFDSEEVKVVFSLVSFFLGTTPFNTPSVYSLLNYTELRHDGYWHVEGGMYKIVEEIENILRQKGVVFHFGTEINKAVSNGEKVQALYDTNGNRWDADLFVINADAAAFRGKIFKRKKFAPEKLDRMQWTLAPFTIYLGVNGKIPSLHHHNFFLGSNFSDYAKKIFRTSVAPEKPYYYVNVSSKSNPACAPDGCENIFILCPVPDRRFKPDWPDAEKLADNIIADLSERTGFDLKANAVTRTVMTPIDWEKQFNLYRGSGLGLAHGMSQVGAFRPSNKDEQYGNVYYVGASTTPGTGLPIVIISSRLVTQRIEKEHAII